MSDTYALIILTMCYLGIGGTNKYKKYKIHTLSYIRVLKLAL